jgi:NitT/TauT family transport system substrate-binding protein
MQRMKDLGRVVVAATATVLALAPQVAAEDLLKVAVAQCGAWETAAPHLGQQVGIFKKHGILLDLTYVDDDPEVPVTSGNADVGVGIGIMDVLRGLDTEFGAREAMG